MEGLIEALASGLGNGIGWMAEHGVLFLVFAAIWIAFGAALVWSQGSLDPAWTWIRGLPLLVQILAWLLFLPVMAGLWVWETTWPVLVRVVLILGLAGWNLLVFLPKALTAARP
jgi:ABC-type amino acid transport system permease subunit